MPPRRRNPEDIDFKIHVDPSCMSEPMDEKAPAQTGERPEAARGHLQATVEDVEPTPTLEHDHEAGDEHVSEDITSHETAAEEPDRRQTADESLLEDISALAVDYMDLSQQEVEPEPDESLHEESVLSGTEGTEHADDYTNASGSRRESAVSGATDSPSRRASGRTEALIHAAALDIVDRIQQNNGRESLQSTSIAEDDSYLSHSQPASARQSDVNMEMPEEDREGHMTAGEEETTADEEPTVQEELTVEAEPAVPDEPPAEEEPYIEDEHTAEGEHDAEDEPTEQEELAVEDEPIVEERPTAEEVPAADGEPAMEEEPTVVRADDAGDSSSHHDNDDDVFSDHSPRSSVGSVSETEQKKLDDDAMSQWTRSPRISDMAPYDVDDDADEEFVPTVRGTPRPPFRSPSSVKAMQMSSPPASVLGSPRSSRRSPLPTVSRLGSPSVSAQFSPKRTPPRFRRNTPPLVLLHATLLPLRWPWGETLDGAAADDLSRGGKALRESWRQLQDRVGDTVLERGILLPHPQNDYEVLEERLLEALELPTRRRARILECGHYLGAANEMTLAEDMESENDDDDFYDGARSQRASGERKTHWCSTCRSEIRYDSLGTEKAFRVKVYASNGLMRAGAWGACWKEMERVDVELEPIVEHDVQEELNRLAAEQEEALELQDEADAGAHEMAEHEEPESSFMEPDQTQPHVLPSSSVPELHAGSSPPFDDRRRRDEERLREIYGHTPPTTAPSPSPTPAAGAPPEEDFLPRETPPSPSVEAMERRAGRRQAYKTASLPELLLEAAKVLMQDKKNVAIALLSVLILALAVRGGGGDGQTPEPYQTIVREADAAPTVTATQAAVHETAGVEMASGAAASEDPCASLSEQAAQVMETVTETLRVTATETHTAFETETAQPVLEQAGAAEAAVEGVAEGDGVAAEDEGEREL